MTENNKKQRSIPSKTSKISKPTVEKSAYTGWRVLAIFIEGIFNLINTNKVYPAILLILVLILGLIVWRLPGSELSEIIKLIINEVLVGKGTLFGVIISSNIVWYYLYQKMQKTYKEEIDRLTKVRSELMHGIENKIEEHRSINDDCKESYILPAPDKSTPDKHDRG